MPGEKTEQPTWRRKQDARSKGQVARSVELGSAVLMLAGFWVLQSSGANAFRELGAIMSASFRDMGSVDLTVQSASYIIASQELNIVRIVAPLFVWLVGVAMVVNLAQTKFLITFHPLMPDFSKISPAAGFKRLLSPQSLMHLGKSLAKAAIVAIVVYRAYSEQFPVLLAMSQMDLRAALGILGQSAVGIGMQASQALLVVAILDYAFQRRQFFSGLKMSKEEVKEEHKQQEGRPEVRARIRQIQRQIAQGRSLPKVRQADVVVVNPTHYAVALKYAPAEMQAPVVLSKGRNYIAAQIRRIATEARVPIVTNPPLAQSLYRAADIGREIPTDLYQAVAEVLAFVYSLRGAQVGRAGR